jgi:hypothetical protein
VVGRFGVGFAAVLAVTDEPVVLSRGGGVRFSRDDTAELVARAAQLAPDLGAEARRRDGHVPVLRLPFATEGSPPEGFDTAVVLPLRDELAADAVREQLGVVDDVLLLALPGLAEVLVDLDGQRRVVADAERRWHVHRRAGRWSEADRAELLADRPTEERRQLGWQVLWAVPVAPGEAVPETLHAPTPTDEPISAPALLLAGFPLDPTRRHVAPGPLTDRLLGECATAYAGLLEQLATGGRDVLDLVPTGLPSGALDGALREQVMSVLPAARVLRCVEDGRLTRPQDAVVLDVDAPPEVLALLASRVAGLVAAERASRAALRALGVATLPLADVVEALAAQGAAAEWHELYTGLASLADDAHAREAMAAVPVPLVDGRVVRGPRGLLLPESGQVDAVVLEPLAQFGLRLVHPDAVHPLLERLGAQPATAWSVLTDPAVRVAVQEAPDGDDPEAVTGAVLSLVAAAVAAGDLASPPAWLRDLLLPDSDGDLTPAGALVVGGSDAERLLDPRDVGVLSAEVAQRWPVEVLRAVGVLDGLAVLELADVDLHDPPEALDDLDGFEQWAAELGGDPQPVDVVAVRDLDLVRPQLWPEVLRHLASDPRRRRALLAPLRGRRAAGVGSGYTAWWLRRELGLLGTVAPDSDDLDGLLERAPGWVGDLDAEVRQALGVVDLRLGATAPRELVQRVVDGLAEPERAVSAERCLQLWRWLSSLDGSGLDRVEVPHGARVLDGPASRVVDASSAVVVDEPKWLQRSDIGGVVVAPAARAEALADLLDLELASERAAGEVTSSGLLRRVPDDVLVVLPESPRQWLEHDALTVDHQPVQWWVSDDGTVHAATPEGLARGLAWAAGRWHLRHAVAEVLAEPGAALRLAVEDAAG